MIPFIRKAHRWVAPVFVLALIAVIITGLPTDPTPAQMAQQLLMVLLTISGVILFVYPFVAKARRKQ
jgi:hypothetical protein